MWMKYLNIIFLLNSLTIHISWSSNMYEEFIILGFSGIISIILILFSNRNVNRQLKNMMTVSREISVSLPSGKYNYIARKKELEYLRDILQNTIARIYKEFEEGKIREDERNLLVSKFRDRLVDVEKELNEVSLYAELEELEREYEKVLKDYEKRKKDLEAKIGRIRDRLKLSGKEVAVEKPVPHPEKKVEKVEKPTRVKEKPDDLSQIMKELTEMMKKLEEGEE